LHKDEDSGSVNPFQDRLLRFFQHYKPQSIPKVATYLLAAKGREELMFRKLCEKYGPEPNQQLYRERLVRFYEHYNPHSLPKVDTYLQAYEGNEEEMFGRLAGKYGPEPPRPREGAETPVPQHLPTE
jgi:hypothetical protein